jgi:hypothetical protein
MKKIISLFILLACVIGFSSCKMKECECYSTNEVIQIDSVIKYEIDTVENFTRGNCEEFNKDEVIIMDSITKVHHSILCTED